MIRLVAMLVFLIIYYSVMFCQIVEINLTKHQRKLRKTQNFLKRISFFAYKDVIPKWALILYYVVIIIHFLTLTIAFWLLHIGKITIILQPINTLLIIDIIQIVIFWSLSWRPGDRISHHEQWATKRKKRK